MSVPLGPNGEIEDWRRAKWSAPVPSVIYDADGNLKIPEGQDPEVVRRLAAIGQAMRAYSREPNAATRQRLVDLGIFSSSDSDTEE